MRTTIAPAQATALAKFLLTVRPDWQLSYTEDAVGRMRLIDDDLEHIVRAAIRGALTPNIRKPDVLAMGGDHWKGRADETVERAHAAVTGRCTDCGGLHAWNAPHDPPEVARVDYTPHVAAARQVVLGKHPRRYDKPEPKPIEDTPIPEVTA